MSIELSMSTSQVNAKVSQPAGAVNSLQSMSEVEQTKVLQQEKLAEAKEVENVREAAAEPNIPREQLEVLAQKLQDFVGSLNRGLEFSVHEDSGRDVIKVIDKESGDTVRQYPSEEVLDLVASLSDAAGIFVNVKA